MKCFPLLCVLQVAVVSAFAQTLRRYTSLNHLAQAARAVLQNTSQINQMLSDLNRVDFANVQVKLCDTFQVILRKEEEKNQISLFVKPPVRGVCHHCGFSLTGWVCLFCLTGAGVMGVSV